MITMKMFNVEQTTIRLLYTLNIFIINQKRGGIGMKKLVSVFACALMVFSLAGCGSSKDSDGKTFVFASELDINSLDSTVADDGMSFNAMHAITDGLMGTDKDGKTTNALAESYELSKDNLTYTFKLKDAKWSNGDAVTANDFVYSWRRIIKNSGNYAYMMGSDGAGVKNADAIMKKQESGAEITDKDLETLGITAKDDKTLVIELDAPCPYFLDLMTFPCYYPQNEKFVEEKGKDYGSSPENTISNGAFVLKSWTKSSSLEFTKNPDYYDAANVKLDNLEMMLAQDPKTASMNFDSNANDYCTINSELVDKYKDSKEFELFNEGYLFYLQLNFKNEALANLNVRKALSYAIDRKDFTENVLKDGSQPARGFIPAQLSTGPDGKDFRETAGAYTDYNVEEAQKAMDTALKELGTDTVKLRLLYGTDESPMDQMAEYLQNAFSKIKGLEIEMVATTKNDRIYNKEANGEFDIALTRWGPDYSDPTTYLNLLLTNNTNNYGKYSSKAFDAKMEEAKANVNDAAARWENLKEAEKIGMEDYAYIPVFEKGAALLKKPKVTGIVHKPVGVPYTFNYVDITE